MADHKAWISSTKSDSAAIAETIDAGLRGIDRLPARGERWAVKLNLTYPTYLPGVVNSPAFVEGLCQWAVGRGISLDLIEGDGGNGSYSAWDAFEGNGISSIAARYNVRCVSISETPWEWRETAVAGKMVRLPYSPYFGRKPFDRLISAPLFKNHIFTIVSLGMKNLWGCIPDAYRMYYHYQLDRGIVALMRELKPDFSIFDGIIAMRGRGPMEGRPLEMNTVLTASDVGTGEAAALEIMGIPIDAVHHLQIAAAEGLVANEQVHWMTDPASFKREDFILERTLLNHLSIRLGRVPLLQTAVYHSVLSPVIYAIVNRIRGNSAQARLIKAKWSGAYHSIPRKRR